jgi:hypothetical protein
MVNCSGALIFLLGSPRVTMIRESVYMEMIRNCSKWNSRTEKERRGRYPVLDAQTGVAQRPSVGARPTLADRFPPANPLQVKG